MRNLILRGGLAVALLGGWLGWNQSGSRAGDNADIPRSQAGTDSGVLVLKTGQLVEGRLSQNAGGYLVQLPKGSYLVPYDRVRVKADDRHGAYEKLKADHPNPPADFRVGLARWCIAWKLYEEARVELRDVLIADPEHKKAREMYARLDRLMHPEKHAEKKRKPKSKTSDGFEASEPESLAALSPDLAKRYVTRVQPILINRCGNAGCHGSASEQDFQLTHLHRGLNRQTLENLDNVLRFVEIESPEDSPLLKKPSGPHGRNGRPIFYGHAGEKNLETLKEWIEQVAEKRGGDSQDDKEKSKPNAFSRWDPFERTEKKSDTTLYRGRPEAPKTQPQSPEERSEEAKEELLNSILRNEQEDAFDPEVFNRKFGERGASAP